GRLTEHRLVVGAGLVSPRVEAAVVPARRAFPLGLAREALLPPRAIGPRVILRDGADRLLRAAEGFVVAQLVGVRAHRMWRAACRGLYAFSIRLVRPLGLVEPERGEGALVRGPLVELADVVRADDRRAFGDEEHAGGRRGRRRRGSARDGGRRGGRREK